MNYLYLICYLIISISTQAFALPHFVLIGPPGSGKGTFSQFLVKKHNYHQICPGDLFRDEIHRQTELGKQIQPIVDRGDYLDNDLVWEILHNQITSTLQNKNAFILDGFPRSPEAFKYLDAFLKENNLFNNTYYVIFTASHAVCLDRITSRLICRNCTHIFNTQNKKPKKENTCDNCGFALSRRKADTTQVGVKRLNYYDKNITPIITTAKEAGYQIICIDTNQSIDKCLQEYEQLIVGTSD